PATFSLSASRQSVRMSSLMDFVRGQLVGAQGAPTGFSATSSGGGLDILFQRFDDAPPAAGLPAGVAPFVAMGGEGYVLSIAPSSAGASIVVAAAEDHGLWNGGMTLLQILLDDSQVREAMLAPVLIRDYPDAAVRSGVLYSAAVTQYPNGQYQ